MPECPRVNNDSTLPPPGFTESNATLKCGQLTDLLQKIIEKCQSEPLYIVEQPKHIELLISIAQLTLLSTPISSDDKRNFLNNIVNIGQDLLKNENNTENDSCNYI